MCGRIGAGDASVSFHLEEGCKGSHSSSQRKKGVSLAPRMSPLASGPPSARSVGWQEVRWGCWWVP